MGRLGLLLVLLLPGCAIGGAQGWGTGSPDPAPRVTKLSVRGPLVRESEAVDTR